MNAIHSAPTKGLLKGASLFDIYRPKGQAAAGMVEGEKSLAVRITLASDEATLTEAEIDNATSLVLDALSAKVGARLRAS
jgi:phenylalanyl-tRNA synthetase beta chain